ncbi:hypothetical protein D3C75_1053800 [compost metagenome]
MLLQHIEDSVLIDAFAPDNRYAVMRQLHPVTRRDITFDQHTNGSAGSRQRYQDRTFGSPLSYNHFGDRSDRQCYLLCRLLKRLMEQLNILSGRLIFNRKHFRIMHTGLDGCFPLCGPALQMHITEILKQKSDIRRGIAA